MPNSSQHASTPDRESRDSSNNGPTSNEVQAEDNAFPRALVYSKDKKVVMFTVPELVQYRHSIAAAGFSPRDALRVLKRKRQFYDLHLSRWSLGCDGMPNIQGIVEHLSRNMAELQDVEALTQKWSHCATEVFDGCTLTKLSLRTGEDDVDLTTIFLNTDPKTTRQTLLNRMAEFASDLLHHHGNRTFVPLSAISQERMFIALFYRANVLVSPEFDIHADLESFLCVVVGSTFTPYENYGFEPQLGLSPCGVRTSDPVQLRELGTPGSIYTAITEDRTDWSEGRVDDFRIEEISDDDDVRYYEDLSDTSYEVLEEGNSGCSAAGNYSAAPERDATPDDNSFEAIENGGLSDGSSDDTVELVTFNPEYSRFYEGPGNENDISTDESSESNDSYRSHCTTPISYPLTPLRANSPEEFASNTLFSSSSSLRSSPSLGEGGIANETTHPNVSEEEDSHLPSPDSESSSGPIHAFSRVSVEPVTPVRESSQQEFEESNEEWDPSDSEEDWNHGFDIGYKTDADDPPPSANDESDGSLTSHELSTTSRLFGMKRRLTLSNDDMRGGDSSNGTRSKTRDNLNTVFKTKRCRR